VAEDLSLSLVEGGGQLVLRGSEEPYEIQAPTSITGTIDAPDPDTGGGTGAITNGTFATPRVSLSQDITTPMVATVYIDADFSQVVPGNLTGTVDETGVVSLRTALSVSLHIDVGRDPVILAADCVASPIQVDLTSTTPYDPVTRQVTLADANFSIPPVVSGGACESNVASAVNDQLAGAGHAISLTVEGELPLPQTVKEPAVTTLAVTPEAGVQAGASVTMVAAVARAPESTVTEDPTGFVDFRDGNQTLASVEVAPDGTATFTTSDLPAGTRTLTARYGGDDIFGSRTTTVTSYPVWSNPALTWDLPTFVQIAGDPTDFTVAATNTGIGQNLTNARLDVTIQRAEGLAPIGPIGGNPRITLDRVEGATVTPIALTFSGTGAAQRLVGSIGAGTGTPLPVGASLTEALRLGLPAVGTVSSTACGASNRLCPGPLRITFTLVHVDPDTGVTVATVASSSGDTLMTEATRRVTTITAGAPGVPAFGVPPKPAISPHTIRAGNTITLNQLGLGSVLNLVKPSGTVAFSIDGRPVEALPIGSGIAPAYSTEVACCRPGSYGIPVPMDTAAGTRTLAIRYSGDSLFQPQVASFTFNVIAPIAPIYECERPALAVMYVARANVVAQGSLPPVVAAGTHVPVVHPALRILLDRGPSTDGGGPWGPALNSVISAFTGVEVTYSVDGESFSSGITRTNDTRMDVAGDPDQVWAFNDLAMAVTIDGVPGEVVPVAIESFRINFDDAGGAMTCKPVGGPVVLGDVTVAGTSLSVSPSGPVRSGGQVTLEASMAPAAGGVVEFRDGTTTLGVVNVDGQGRASMTTTALGEGAHELTARYFGGLSIPSTTSAPVALVVGPEFECAAFSDEGHGRTVRLVYLELLGRCPDQVGYDHWVARLDGGTSQAVFARSIARTSEAVGRVVDDAYETMLGRPADASGRAFWTARLQSHGRYDQLLADLGASSEFWSKAGSSNEGFVTRVYDRLLGRAPDAAGLAHWTGRLDAGVSRGALIRTIANLDEPLRRLVGSSYEEILARAPVGAEITDGVTDLRRTGDRSGLYAQLIGTPEFAQRAQGLPNPEG